MGRQIDEMTIKTIRDADDYSDYVEDGAPRYHMMSSNRWERMVGKPWRAIYQDVTKGNYLGGYLTLSQFFDARLERCFLWDVQVDSCTLRNCHVHFTSRYELSGCAFYDCLLTTEAGDHASVVFTDGAYIHNCTLKGNFTQTVGQADLQTVAEDSVAVQAPPYEVHNNIVFKDCVVNCLRRWVWAYRLRQRQSQRSGRFARYAPKQSWKSKAAGKRPMRVHTSYDVTEQLDLPERRCEWSVGHTKVERLSPPRKRKIEIDLTLDDD